MRNLKHFSFLSASNYNGAMQVLAFQVAMLGQNTLLSAALWEGTCAISLVFSGNHACLSLKYQ